MLKDLHDGIFFIIQTLTSYISLSCCPLYSMYLIPATDVTNSLYLMPDNSHKFWFFDFFLCVCAGDHLASGADGMHIDSPISWLIHVS